MKRLDLAKSLPKKPITVLLAEDNVSFRKSVKALIEADGEFEVVGEAKNGREAVDLALGLLPEVVIMDIAMPLLNGLQATQQIMARSSATSRKHSCTRLVYTVHRVRYLNARFMLSRTSCKVQSSSCS